LHGIRWETYERLLEDLETRRLRLTYDGGTLEIMSPSQPHERVKHLLGRMICAMAEELRIPVEGGGSTTWRREDLEKGLEADECYWVANEPRVRRRDVDLRHDPPPDLVLEVDVHAGCLDRLQIYAALGVPEIWRWKDGEITIHLLGSDGSYRVAERSVSFPALPVAELAKWVDRHGELDQTALMRAFRAWVRAARGA
jgi:Uma2 family endonuclease